MSIIYFIRMCDQITPEALIMALYCSSSGCLLICSDEFKVISFFFVWSSSYGHNRVSMTGVLDRLT